MPITAILIFVLLGHYIQQEYEFAVAQQQQRQLAIAS